MGKLYTALKLCMVMIGGLSAIPDSLAQTPAKRLFGGKALPSAQNAAAHGFYSKGCLSGGVAIPVDGPNWQAMRLSRNRRWGHPTLIGIIEQLSYKAKNDGWNGILVGDISQPRGGPMLTGHRSHQMGLDADLWFMPMPNKRYSYNERENTSAISVLKKGSYYVDKSRWTRAHTMLLYHAASFPQIERILVHPGIKKQLCDTVKGNRAWLNKIRPTWGHHYHFHLRIGCPPGSPNCRTQKSTGSATGCEAATMNWWFNVGLKPAKPKPGVKPRKRRELILNDLPQACQVVLKSGSPNLEQATHRPIDASFVAPKIELPAYSISTVLRGKPIEASKNGASIPISTLPIPSRSPRK
ncbi:MAG: penicillin-insensitive murein endopeptidase [Pseudomonadota bacterium]